MSQKIYPETTHLENLLKSYGRVLDIDVIGVNITEKNAESLFELILKEYVDGKLSIDDVSMMCEAMYGKVPAYTELHDLLLSAAEIEWEIRHKPLSAAATIEELLRKFIKSALE